MSSEYHSREVAFQMGLYYLGRQDLCHKPLAAIMDSDSVRMVKGAEITQLGEALEESVVIEVCNDSGIPVWLGSARFKGGYDLWVIDPETQFGRRL